MYLSATLRHLAAALAEAHGGGMPPFGPEPNKAQTFATSAVRSRPDIGAGTVLIDAVDPKRLRPADLPRLEVIERRSSR